VVGILIRMKLAVLHRSLNGPRRSLLFWGAGFGLLGAAATIWVSLLDLENPAIKSDLLAAVFAAWALVWALGPMLIGGEDTTLRPE
jgi:ABC-2 type transport system permease protein